MDISTPPSSPLRTWMPAIATAIGALLIGLALNQSVRTFKAFDRTVTVRGLDEREFTADVAIWPIMFTQASNRQDELYTNIESDAAKVIAFLESRGIGREEISVNLPVVTDRSAQRWGGETAGPFRYVGSQSVTVYSDKVDVVRDAMADIAELGKQGVTVTANEYGSTADYLFTRLNEVKPAMIEASTIEARKVAEKFAQDSNSRLGKIHTASQGQFTIENRDMNNPHIKKVRVVSTVTYYLVD